MFPISTIAELTAPIANEMDRLNRVIQEQLHSDIALIRQVAHYIIYAGGKRLRPLLVLLVARAFGAQTSPEMPHVMLTLAAVVEFIHTATLLHDDVVDESSLRRGQQTANALFGNSSAILVGDFLYSRAFQMMVSVNCPRVMAIVSNATNVIAEGEVLQLLNMRHANVTETDYLHVVSAKTAKLFEAAAQLGVLAADMTDTTLLNAAGDYARLLGIAFQLMDDVLDYTGHTQVMGKRMGDDLREGKPTLPLIYLLKHGSADDKAWARHCISHGIVLEDDEGMTRILYALNHSGALTYTRQVAQQAAQQAAQHLAVFPSNIFTKALKALTFFAVERNH